MCRLLKSICVHILLKLTLVESWKTHLHKQLNMPHTLHTQPPHTNTLKKEKKKKNGSKKKLTLSTAELLLHHSCACTRPH